MCFWRCPCWKNFSIIWRCWYNFSYYTTSYTTTCVTFIDRFTIWKEKSSVLIKLVFCFLFTNCSPKFSVSSCSRHIVSAGYGSEKTLPSRSCQVRFIPCHALCLEQHSCGVPHRADTLVFCSWIFFFSFIFIIFVFLSIRQGCTRPDLSVAVKPFFYHLRDQGVISPPRALLHGHENAPLSHAAVQPLPEQFFLLFLIT